MNKPRKPDTQWAKPELKRIGRIGDVSGNRGTLCQGNGTNCAARS